MSKKIEPGDRDLSMPLMNRSSDSVPSGPAQVTAKLNEVYAEGEAELDSVLVELQRRSMGLEEPWGAPDDADRGS